MLHGAVALSPHARARVIRIDTTRARALPGVVRVATARDVPGDRWVGLIYKDWPVLVAEGEEVRAVGDVLAAVAAESPRIAREAAALVEVEYQLLPAVLDPAESIKPGAPQVNPRHANVLSTTQIERGDVDAALAASAHVVTGKWATQRIEHLFLEPEAALAVPMPDGRLHLYTQGQGIFDDRRQVASVLGEPEEKVFAELVPNGGAFGGKEDMSIQAQTALLARLTGRPVRLVLTREQSIRMHPKRHPITMSYTVGCDAEGRLTAARIDLLGDSGAYASVGGKVLERAAGHACGPYRVPAVKVDAIAAYTNNPPCGAMRGFGVNQTSFAMEGCIDLLAAKVGIDGWEMRFRNGLRVGDTFTTGQVLEKSVGLEKTLLAVKDAYYAARKQGRAVGIACGVKNSGIGNGAVESGKCRLVVEAGGKVGLYAGFTEMGQGLLTILAQVAAEVTGLPAGTFVPRVDSRFELGAGQTTGSRATLLAGRGRARGREEAARRPRPGEVARRPRRAGVRRRDRHRRHHRAGPDEEREDQDPHLVRLGHPGGGPRRRGQARAGHRGARRRARHQPPAVRGPDRGLGAHGARLRAHRGASLQGRHAGDLPAARHRRPARPAHAGGRGHPGRGSRAGGSVRREGGRRDRPRSHRRRGGRGAAGLRRRSPHAPAHEGLARSAGHQRGTAPRRGAGRVALTGGREAT